MHRSRFLKARAAVVAVLTLLLPTGAGAAGANLPGGTAISVDITSPADGTLRVAGLANTVSGTASIGEGLAATDTTLVSVIDVSGSTGIPGGPCGNPNMDASTDTILDCEVAAVTGLHTSADSAGTIDEVGIAVFGSTAKTADMTPLGLDDPITLLAADLNANLDRDADEVARSATNSGLGLFTPKNEGGATNFVAGLEAALGIVQADTNPNAVVAFLSDGVSTSGSLADFNTALTALQAENATVHTFAVGSGSSCTGGAAGTLDQIALSTGGTCTPVSDPSALPDVLPAAIGAQLTGLDAQVGAGPVVSLAAAAGLPKTGPDSAAFAFSSGPIAAGDNLICVKASGTDSGGAGDVSHCVTETGVDISAAPAFDTVELGSVGQTHTVDGGLDAAGNGVAGRQVSFEVVSGPNAGANGNLVTSPGGAAAFTYSLAQGPAGLGVDVIQACWTDDFGDADCALATLEVADTTAPSSDCEPTTNPAGLVIPRAGLTSPGQNEDGYYKLTAADSVDPSAQLWLADEGSDAVFGPYPSGTRIKYTQAAGRTPSEQKMGGSNSAVDYHVTGKGDALVTATDDSGNESQPTACRVPQPPK
jgi:hypothetical protein